MKYGIMIIGTLDEPNIGAVAETLKQQMIDYASYGKCDKVAVGIAPVREGIAAISESMADADNAIRAGAEGIAELRQAAHDLDIDFEVKEPSALDESAIDAEGSVSEIKLPEPESKPPGPPPKKGTGWAWNNFSKRWFKPKPKK